MAELLFPLQFKRQYSGPLDPDMVFATSAAMTTYLSDPIRYAGQMVTCLETSSAYVLNNTMTAWTAVGGSGGVTSHGALTGLSADDHPQYLTSARGDLRYSKTTHTHDIGLLSGASGYDLAGAIAYGNKTGGLITDDDISVNNDYMDGDYNTKWIQINGGVYSGVVSQYRTSAGVLGGYIDNSVWDVGAGMTITDNNSNSVVLSFTSASTNLEITRGLNISEGSYNISGVPHNHNGVYLTTETSALFATSGHTHPQYALSASLSAYMPYSTSGTFSLSGHNHDGRYALSAHNQAWSTISATPTTLAGYGITDAQPTSAMGVYALSTSLSAYIPYSTSGTFSLSGHNHSLSALNGTLPITMISATGTPTSITYLRGDGSWSTVSGGTSVTTGTLSATPSSVITITNGTSAVVGSGTGISISQATSSTNGYVTSSDWNTFNSKVSSTSLSAYIPQSTSGSFALSGHNHDGVYLAVGTSASFATSGHVHNQYALSASLSAYMPYSTSGSFSLSGHNHDLSALGGLLSVSQINSVGTPSSTTYLRGDGSWSTPAGGGGGTSGVNYKQTGTFNIIANTSGIANITLSPSMDLPYLVQFLDATDNNGVFQNFSVINYAIDGFTVFWNASPTSKTITWFAIDGIAQNKHNIRTSSVVSINTTDYIITYTGSTSITQPLFPATGSGRELVFTNDSNNLNVIYTISTSAGTIGRETSFDLYDAESITVFDAAVNVWEIH